MFHFAILVALLWGGPVLEREDAISFARRSVEQSNEVAPEASIPDLKRALEGIDVIQDKPINDEAILALREEVELSLARSYLVVGDMPMARLVMARAIRDAAGKPLATEGYGPSLESFYKERLELLQKDGLGRISVNCGVPCQVLIQDHKVETLSEALVLGEYRVLVLSTAGAHEPLATAVTLDHEGHVASINYEVPTILVDEAKPAERRTAPRWLEVSGLVSGAVLVSVGVVLLAFDSRCATRDPIEECPRLYDNLASGISTLTIGSAALIGFGAVFVSDEVQSRRGGNRTVMLSWNIRF